MTKTKTTNLIEETTTPDDGPHADVEITHEAPKDATPKLSTRRIPRPEKIAPTVHVGHDNDRRRHVHYNAACPACRLDDKARREPGPHISEEELYRTIFLIPDFAPERRIAEIYVQRTYPGAQNIGSSLNYQLVPQMPDIQIVVVARRPEPGHSLTPHVKQQLRIDNKWEEIQVPPEELVHEVLESAPITVGDSVQVSPMSLTTHSMVNTDELVERLAEVSPGYRIFRQNPPDQLIVLQAE
jgi:hypothetical protein